MSFKPAIPAAASYIWSSAIDYGDHMENNRPQTLSQNKVQANTHLLFKPNIHVGERPSGMDILSVNLILDKKEKTKI